VADLVIKAILSRTAINTISI